MTVPESLPKGLFPVAAITLLGSFSLTVLLFVLPTMIGIRDDRLFSSSSVAESFWMRCFLSASSLNEELLPLLSFNPFTLRTGILDFRWTEERRALSHSISRLLDAIALFNCGFWHRAKTTTFSKLFLCFAVWFCSALQIFSLVWAWKVSQFSCSKSQCWPHRWLKQMIEFCQKSMETVFDRFVIDNLTWVILARLHAHSALNGHWEKFTSNEVY